MPKRVRPRSNVPRSTYIRAWREARGLTINELAIAIDATQATVSRIETGKATLTWSAITAIADVLELEPYDLLFRDPHGTDMQELWAQVQKATPQQQERVARIVRALLAEDA